MRNHTSASRRHNHQTARTTTDQAPRTSHADHPSQAPRTNQANRASQTNQADDAQATQRYLRLIESIHAEWDDLEARADTSVLPSGSVMQTVMEAVRADARHGAQVQAPPTDLGPYTLSELSLRSLVRAAVDTVPGVRALRSSFEHAPATDGHRGPGLPVTIRCRISAHASPGDLPDLSALAQQVRQAVRRACQDHLAISPAVDVHVEDLHDDDNDE